MSASDDNCGGYLQPRRSCLPCSLQNWMICCSSARGTVLPPITEAWVGVPTVETGIRQMVIGPELATAWDSLGSVWPAARFETASHHQGPEDFHRLCVSESRGEKIIINRLAYKLAVLQEKAVH